MSESNVPSRFQPESSLVLVVEDMPENFHPVAGLLKEAGYQVAFAGNTDDAWKRLIERSPDLILLNVGMVGGQEFEFCRTLRLNPETCEIPVIFLTIAIKTHQVVRGLEMGAVDYVTKPFQSLELLARVRMHIGLKQARDILLRQFRELHVLVDEKNEVVRSLVHNLRNPVWAISELSRYLADNPGSTPKEVDRFAIHLGDGARRIMTLLDDLLDTEALGFGGIQPTFDDFDLVPAVRVIVGLYESVAARRGQGLEWIAPQEPVMVRGDRKWVEQIIDNLLSNAIKYSPPGKAVKVAVRKSEGRGIFEVVDEGQGISVDEQSLLFQGFTRLSARPTGGEPSIGMGLSIAQRFARLLGGDIRCVSCPDEAPGSRFILDLPGVA